MISPLEPFHHCLLVRSHGTEKICTCRCSESNDWSGHCPSFREAMSDHTARQHSVVGPKSHTSSALSAKAPNAWELLTEFGRRIRGRAQARRSYSWKSKSEVETNRLKYSQPPSRVVRRCPVRWTENQTTTIPASASVSCPSPDDALVGLIIRVSSLVSYDMHGCRQTRGRSDLQDRKRSETLCRGRQAVVHHFYQGAPVGNDGVPRAPIRTHRSWTPLSVHGPPRPRTASPCLGLPFALHN
jgi:hypothetical protein